MKRTILSIVVLMAAISAMAQTWKVVKTDGSVVSFHASFVNYVTVTSDPASDYVDLELPSGTLWATCNIGAKNPEDYGDYFAWGEITGYGSGEARDFFWYTYKYCGGSKTSQTKYNYNSNYGIVDNKMSLELIDDAAYVNWGSLWRMPSKEQFDELIDGNYTTIAWITQNGVYGCKITSKSNGISIFLPAAGYRYSTLFGNENIGLYWSRTLHKSNPYNAWYMWFGSEIKHSGTDRYNGLSVRPVRAQ